MSNAIVFSTDINYNINVSFSDNIMQNFLEKMYHQNPWWDNFQIIAEDIHLKELNKNKFVFLNKDFLNHKFEDGVYIVTGPRQIGKTTHLKLLIKQKINETNHEDFLYFNCDLLESKNDIVDLVESYLKNTLQNGRKYILLDEITAIKDSILAIKYLIDQGTKHNHTYILTGSSTVNIKKTGEFLPGRRGHGQNFVFSPVSFADFLSALYPNQLLHYTEDVSLEKFYIKLKQIVPLESILNQYLICGGIPRVINNYMTDKCISLGTFNLYQDWLISEIAKNGKREHIVKIILERILRSLSSDISYHAIAVDTSLGSHNTVYDYLTFLEDAFVIKQIYNYAYQQKKIQFRKNKKIYLTDPFLFWLNQWWLNGDAENYKNLAKNSLVKSKLIENVCFIHLQKLFSDVYFYRTSSEIDFIHKNLAFESKYQDKIAPSDVLELIKFPGRKFVISKNTFQIMSDYQVLPTELFLLLPKDYFLKN